jgi:hypothetical protein
MVKEKDKRISRKIFVYLQFLQHLAASKGKSELHILGFFKKS